MSTGQTLEADKAELYKLKAEEISCSMHRNSLEFSDFERYCEANRATMKNRG